jgi:hypothetical protein
MIGSSEESKSSRIGRRLGISNSETVSFSSFGELRRGRESAVIRRMRARASLSTWRYNLDMATIRIKLNNVEATRRYIEEMNSYTWESDRPRSAADYGYPRERSHIWKTIRTEAKSRDVDPKTARLEAQAGEDGVFRIKGETIQEEELERLREKIGKRMQRDIDQMIRGAWETPDEDE